ncbi:unnamed protein product [Heligmosomoides polygyrus]|uniref:Cytochrome P450 n=1 Tax=Heligmosomoides polygyrus TaxID=6339 RepID=A0A183FM49_HELPZ|nr:unnamed protein product [Heligmosomoides polygyrus]
MQTSVGMPHTVEDSVVLDVSKKIRTSCEETGVHPMLTPGIPHVLADSVRFTRVITCQSLLPRPHREELLEDLITGDEKWVPYSFKANRAVWLP